MSSVFLPELMKGLYDLDVFSMSENKLPSGYRLGDWCEIVWVMNWELANV